MRLFFLKHLCLLVRITLSGNDSLLTRRGLVLIHVIESAEVTLEHDEALRFHSSCLVSYHFPHTSVVCVSEKIHSRRQIQCCT